MDKLDNKTLKVILENSADSVVVTNKNGIIQYVNPAFSFITGYSSEEAIGETPRILKSGEHNQKFYKELWNTILCGNKIRVIFINKKKSGEKYYHEEIITPIKEYGEITGFVSNGRDVTELVKKNNKLEEYCKFIDTVFETLSSQISAYELLKTMKYKIGD